VLDEVASPCASLEKVINACNHVRGSRSRYLSGEEPNDAIHLLILRRTVDSAPFNPEIGLRKRASWTPGLEPKFLASYDPDGESLAKSPKSAKGSTVARALNSSPLKNAV